MTIPVRSFVKAFNRANILNAIRTTGMISRKDIAKNLGLSKASLTGITAELIKEGLIVEKDAGPYQIGRRPILLAINPNGAYALGVNIEIHEISIVIINFQAEIQASYILPLENICYSPEELIVKIEEAIQKCMWNANFSKQMISGIGIGIPGLIDSRSGTIKYMPNYGWKDVNFRGMLSARLHHNIFIDNSSNNLALMEQWSGKSDSDDFIIITIENGVGSGCVVNGQLMRGSHGIAGEFGHLCINPEGPICRCGKRGCIEAYAGINSILKISTEAAEKGFWKSDVTANIAFENIIEEIRKGNPEIKKIIDKAGEALGLGISYLIKLFDPEKIILTGIGVQENNFLFAGLFKVVEENLSNSFGGCQTKIVIKSWTDEDWAKGAGTLVLQEIYKSPAIKH